MKAKSKQKGKRSILGSVLLLFNWLAIIGLLVVYAGAMFPPDFIWPLALPGLVYPFLLLANFLFVLYWMARRRWFFLFSLIAIAIGWRQLTNTVQFRLSKPTVVDADDDTFKLLSYNVRVFDLYNYGPRWQLNFTQRNNILQFLQEHDFDIVCMQEFVHDSTGKFKTLDTIPSVTGLKHWHTGYTSASHNINFFGLATFSNFPVINKGELEFTSRMGNLAIYTDILVNQDTIRVYNVHFESIGLSPEDYSFVENLTNTEKMTDGEYVRRSSWKILMSMRQAFQKRIKQVELVKTHVDQSPYPVILAGDFNDTPTSWAYNQLRNSLKDAFSQSHGLGATYRGKIPGLRIDYILHSDDLTPLVFETGRQDYSDHRPVWATFQLPQN